MGAPHRDVGSVTRRGWLLFLAVGVIWGLPYLLIRVSVREVSPALLVFLRTGGGAVLLGPIAAARGALRPVLAHWRPVLVFTVVEMGVPWFLLFHAEEKLSSSLAGLLIAAVPLVAAVLAWATRSERLDLRRIVGLLIGFSGVAALVGFAVRSNDLVSALSLGVVACGYAVGPVGAVPLSVGPARRRRHRRLADRLRRALRADRRVRAPAPRA